MSGELAQRGHRLLVLAPSRSRELVRESRRLIRAAREAPEALFDPDGGVRVLGVGELLPLQRRGGAPSPPVDVARTIEEVLTLAPLDFVHVHEPFAPSASSVALRHSRALNVGSFHAPTERVLSTQVARRFVELFFGRLDARTASFGATRKLMERFFPAPLPAAAARRGGGRAHAATTGPLRFAFCAQEERAGAAAVPARAAATAATTSSGRRPSSRRPAAAPTGALRSRLRDRLTLAVRRRHGRERGAGQRRRGGRRLGRPGARARAARARARRRRGPVARAFPAYEEVLGDGELGLLFEPGDVDVLAGQLERARAATRRCADALRSARRRASGDLAWSRVADEAEAIYAELAALRRPPGRPARGPRAAPRRGR